MMLDKNLLGWSPIPVALDGGDIYLRDERDQVISLVSHPQSWYARRSSSVTIAFLKKSVSSGISPFVILMAPRVGQEEDAIAALSAPESCPESSALADGATGAAGA
jgi:hypothetical protein